MYKKTILITGANGEIGQSLIKYFQSENKYKIIALDISGNLHDLNIEQFITGSITDKKLLEKIFNKNKIDTVYHLAAILSSKAELNQELAYDVNVNGSKNIINFSVNSKNNIQFFFPSSIAVYNTQNITKTINENDCLDTPLTIYGQNKLEIENYGIHKNNKSFNFKCIRFPGIISATSIPTGGTSDYAPEMIHSAAQNKNYSCFANAKSKLPFIVMPDAIKAIIMLMQTKTNKLNSNVYNITAFHPSIEEFYLETLKYFNNFKIEYIINEQRQKIINSWPDKINDENARNDWDWKPNYNFQSAYSQYIIPKINSYYQRIEK